MSRAPARSNSWIELLSKDRRFRGVAVIGHSEGSLTGMVAAKTAWGCRFRVEVAKLAVPALVIQGDTDLQTSVADAQLLQKACKRCEFRIVAGMNHVLKIVPADPQRQMASYGDPSLPLAPELVPTIAAFLAGTMHSDPLK